MNHKSNVSSNASCYVWSLKVHLYFYSNICVNVGEKLRNYNCANFWWQRETDEITDDVDVIVLLCIVVTITTEWKVIKLAYDDCLVLIHFHAIIKGLINISIKSAFQRILFAFLASFHYFWVFNLCFTELPVKKCCLF